MSLDGVRKALLQFSTWFESKVGYDRVREEKFSRLSAQQISSTEARISHLQKEIQSLTMQLKSSQGKSKTTLLAILRRREALRNEVALLEKKLVQLNVMVHTKEFNKQFASSGDVYDAYESMMRRQTVSSSDVIDRMDRAMEHTEQVTDFMDDLNQSLSDATAVYGSSDVSDEQLLDAFLMEERLGDTGDMLYEQTKTTTDAIAYSFPAIPSHTPVYQSDDDSGPSTPMQVQTNIQKKKETSRAKSKEKSHSRSQSRVTFADGVDSAEKPLMSRLQSLMQ